MKQETAAIASIAVWLAGDTKTGQEYRCSESHQWALSMLQVFYRELVEDDWSAIWDLVESGCKPLDETPTGMAVALYEAYGLELDELKAEREAGYPRS